MEQQKPILSFFLAPTNILQINYDDETRLTYIYIIENEGRTNADLVVYSLDLNNVMSKKEDIIAPIEELLEEFYFKNYTTLENISNKAKIGRFNKERLKELLSFNEIYGYQNMTTVAMKLYQNAIERNMLRKENIQDEYIKSIVELIRNEEYFDTLNRPVDIEWIEKNTVFQRVDESKFDERLIFTDEFIDDLLRHKEDELFISYEKLCKIISDFDFYDALREEEQNLYDKNS